jgi:hypothetical protein
MSSPVSTSKAITTPGNGNGNVCGDGNGNGNGRSENENGNAPTPTPTPTHDNSIIEIPYSELCSLEQRFRSLQLEQATDGGDASSDNNVMIQIQDTLTAEYATLVQKLGQAYGETSMQEDNGSSSSLGILLVTDMPQEYVQLRRDVLREIQQLGALSPSALEQVTCSESNYQMGWSHGKEKLSPDKYDTSKGSFYFNPLILSKGQSLVDAIRERDGSTSSSSTVDNNDNEWRKDADVTTPNLWPCKSLPQLEPLAMDMGQLICHVGHKIALLCDLYVAQQVS